MAFERPSWITKNGKRIMVGGPEDKAAMARGSARGDALKGARKGGDAEADLKTIFPDAQVLKAGGGFGREMSVRGEPQGVMKKLEDAGWVRQAEGKSSVSSSVNKDTWTKSEFSSVHLIHSYDPKGEINSLVLQNRNSKSATYAAVRRTRQDYSPRKVR